MASNQPPPSTSECYVHGSRVRERARGHGFCRGFRPVSRVGRPKNGLPGSLGLAPASFLSSQGWTRLRPGKSILGESEKIACIASAAHVAMAGECSTPATAKEGRGAESCANLGLKELLQCPKNRVPHLKHHPTRGKPTKCDQTVMFNSAQNGNMGNPEKDVHQPAKPQLASLSDVQALWHLEKG